MKATLKNILYKILTVFISRESLLQLISNKEEKVLLNFKNQGYLHDIGWLNSIDTNSIVDVNNAPLPWVTYPFIAFIEARINKNLSIFEFGSGNSTLYYAQRAATVTSVENDAFWYKKTKSTMPANVNLYECELIYGGAYSEFALNLPDNFDIIIVDGRDRVNCCKKSLNALTPQGVIVLDDSDRKNYDEAGTFLKDNGFKTIDFWGLAPNINYLKCTTVFYRAYNCLGI